MNVRIQRSTPLKLNKSQQKALDNEVNRQLKDMKNEFLMDADAMILYTLHKEFGFGKQRLIKFFKTFINDYGKFIDEYDVEGGWMAAYRLKEATGLDIKELHKEMGL